MRGMTGRTAGVAVLLGALMTVPSQQAQLAVPASRSLPESPAQPATVTEPPPRRRTGWLPRPRCPPARYGRGRRRPGPGPADDVLAAYTLAVAVSPPECHITTPILAAIGQVESGNLAGHRLDAEHRVSPEIVGPVLDGKRYRAVADTDGGDWDGDKKSGPRARPDADHSRELAGRRPRHGRRRCPRPAEHLRRRRRGDGLPLRRRSRPLDGRRLLRARSSPTTAPTPTCGRCWRGSRSSTTSTSPEWTRCRSSQRSECHWAHPFPGALAGHPHRLQADRSATSPTTTTAAEPMGPPAPGRHADAVAEPKPGNAATRRPRPSPHPSRSPRRLRTRRRPDAGRCPTRRPPPTTRRRPRPRSRAGPAPRRRTEPDGAGGRQDGRVHGSRHRDRRPGSATSRPLETRRHRLSLPPGGSLGRSTESSARAGRPVDREHEPPTRVLR